MARALVMDDEAPIRDLLRDFLETRGHEVIEAVNGEEGLRLYQEDPTDIVITDIYMPGLNGLEVIQHLRRDHPASKIILIAAEFPPDSEDVGADRVFGKPFELVKVLEAVEELLGEG